MNSINSNSIQNLARNAITRLHSDEKGQGMTENIIVLMSIAVVAIVQGTIALQVFEYVSRGA